MRILVFSDSHGNTTCMDRAMRAVGAFDAVIHLGDIERDVRYLEKVCTVPVYAVLGNNDFGSVRETERVITLGGVNIFMCHGHTRSVRSGTEAIEAAAAARDCSVALYGHTHRSDDRVENGILVFNPGSCHLPRNGRPSFGILEIEDGKCSSVVADWII